MQTSDRIPTDPKLISKFIWIGTINAFSLFAIRQASRKLLMKTIMLSSGRQSISTAASHAQKIILLKIRVNNILQMWQNNPHIRCTTYETVGTRLVYWIWSTGGTLLYVLGTHIQDLSIISAGTECIQFWKHDAEFMGRTVTVPAIAPLQEKLCALRFW